MEDTKAAIIKLKMYKQKQEVIEMKESQLVLLESAKLKLANYLMRQVEHERIFMSNSKIC